MRAVWLATRIDIWRRLRSALVLIIVLGISWGAVLAAAAGADRTASAKDRFAVRTHAPQFRIEQGDPNIPWLNKAAQLDFDQIQHLPEVAAMNRYVNFLVDELYPPTGSPRDDVRAIAASRRDSLRAVNHEGRDVKATDPNEISVSRFAADTLKLHVGDAIRIRFMRRNPKVWRSTNTSVNDPGGPVFSFRIVGISLLPIDYENLLRLTLSRSFLTSHRGELASIDIADVQLRGHKDPQDPHQDFVDRLAKLDRQGRDPAINPLDDWRGNQAPEKLQAQTLRLWSLVAAFFVVLVFRPLVVRQAAYPSTARRVLAALGMTRAQSWVTSILRAVVIVMASALIAAVVAVALSPLAPIGQARAFDPDSAIRVESRVLALGGIALVLAMTGLISVPAWRRSRTTALPQFVGEPMSAKVGPLRRSRLSRSSPLSVGTRFATARGDREGSIRSSSIVLVLALVIVVGSLTFFSRLQWASTTPKLFGWNWDLALESDTPPQSDASNRIATALAREPRIKALSHETDVPGNFRAVDLPGHPEFSLSLVEQLKGPLLPLLLRGRMPSRQDEAVLPDRFARRYGVHVGDTVVVQPSFGGSAEVQRLTRAGVFRVSGPAPELLQRGLRVTGFTRNGAYVIPDGLGYLLPNVTLGPLNLHRFMVRHGTSLTMQQFHKALVRDLRRHGVNQQLISGLHPYGWQPPEELGTWSFSRGGDVDQHAELLYLLAALSGIVVVGAFATVGYGLFGSIMRRRRQLGILKALGFARKDIAVVVESQATVIAICGFVGLLLGLAAANWAWAIFIRLPGDIAQTELLTSVRAPVPWPWLIITTLASLIVTNLVAISPALTASRTRTAATLRAE